MTTDTDTEEDVMEKQENSKEETAVTAVSSFSQAAEPELEPKKVCMILPVILTVYWAALHGCKDVKTEARELHSLLLSFGKFPCRVEIVEIVSEYSK